MYCELTKKPIVDMSTCSRNRIFKVPGSSKYHGFYQYALPSRKFFMATRMADRLKPPDLKTEQLNLKGTMTFRSSALCHTQERQRSKRKRQGIALYTGKSKNTMTNSTLELVKPLSRRDKKKKAMCMVDGDKPSKVLRRFLLFYV